MTPRVHKCHNIVKTVKGFLAKLKAQFPNIAQSRDFQNVDFSFPTLF